MWRYEPTTAPLWWQILAVILRNTAATLFWIALMAVALRIAWGGDVEPFTALPLH